MEDKVSSLLHLFNSFKMAGRSATFVLSTKRGKTTTAKLEVELSSTKAPSTPPTLPGCQGAEGRHRPQLLQQREPGPMLRQPSIGSTRLCPSQEATMVMQLGLLAALHPLLDDLFVSTPLRPARTAAES